MMEVAVGVGRDPAELLDFANRVRAGSTSGCGHADELGCWRTDPFEDVRHKGEGPIALLIIRSAKVHADDADGSPQNEDDHDARENLADHVEGMPDGLSATKPGGEVALRGSAHCHFPIGLGDKSGAASEGVALDTTLTAPRKGPGVDRRQEPAPLP